jgi:hypothetical protein
MHVRQFVDEFTQVKQGEVQTEQLATPSSK